MSLQRIAVEDALRGDDFFLAAIESSPDCVKVLDAEGRIIFISDVGLSLMDLPSREAVEGSPWIDFWPEGGKAMVAAALRGAADGASSRFTAPCPTSAGKLKYWDVIITPIQKRRWRAATVLVTSRDVTELVTQRMEAEGREIELRRQAAALRSAGELAKVGGWELDFRNNQTTWSDELWMMLGAAPRPLRIEEGLAIFAPEDRLQVLALHRHAQETGERVTFEAWVTRFDGRKIWCRTVGDPEFVGGVCTTLRGSSQDLTEMKAALDASARAERRLKIAAEIANLHVYEIDYERRELISEGAGDTFFETPPTFEGIRRDPYFGVDVRDRQETRKAWEKAQAEGLPYQAEYRIHRSDGSEIWASSAAELIRDGHGRPLRLVGAMQNISGRKQAQFDLQKSTEQAEAANRAKSTFLANMSHEIRTPLNGVIGMAQVMGRDELAPAQRERLNVIRDSGETLLAVLNDILDISKIEAGQCEIDEFEFDLRETIEAACRPFSVLAAQKDLGFKVTVSDTAQGTWWGDGVRLRQIVGNLISNAVKFTSSGEVSVIADANAGGLTVEVVDTGIGIARAHLASVFENFAQADGSISRRFGGTGLGLAISRQLAQLMGGSVSVTSEEGVGSRFSVVLPLDRRSTSIARANVRETENRALHGEGLVRVLAVEDNVTNQLVIRALLEPLGVDLQIACDGLEAVEAFDAGVFDLILMDVQMPRMNGVEATREIRRRESKSGRRRTPVIALSANVMAHQVSEYLAAGMDGFIAKPIDAARLFEAIEDAVAETNDQQSLTTG